MRVLREAHSIMIQIREIQSPGEYILSVDADHFDSPLTLKIGNKVYRKTLSIGKNYSVNENDYTFSRIQLTRARNRPLRFIVRP